MHARHRESGTRSHTGRPGGVSLAELRSQSESGSAVGEVLDGRSSRSRATDDFIFILDADEKVQITDEQNLIAL